uniref:Mitochondrial carrier protein n=1 Tax=Neobodo designis TaxID=312471 RepID=A0A7S1L1P9_NEODS|mmetsp:Transcript_13152/g.40883  ORF Transcript_13152/g.40883 Transcript_13152/m.40883 type:complete len:320 (+) Transcript_13152:144-1103(+)|eukprot:CAMPEP_0174849568 /NCGR_PEP_ID=MMETSP1114-20130205/16634_1 /TAXON_ID=312471 /ORGANISM="Neobodo designis, Strain CCAP 1951/1" /LENGTH=319 /DNA_ID=CAMNT_0016083939 /DNA_START=149 /DNA_END=1108 /DNA_ORIENTATION=+
MATSSSNSHAAPSAEKEKIDAPPVPWMHGAAGITAGAVSMTMFYPLDLIRTRLHAQTGDTGSKLRGAKKIFADEGIRGLYRGVKIAVASHSIGWGMYLTVFRTFQQAFARSNGDSSAGDFLAACCAAVFTATLVTPLNVLKTRSQLREDKQKSGALKRLRAIVASEGPGAILKGVGPQILLSTHTTIQVALYECAKRRLWGKDDAPMLGVACVSGLSKAVASTVCNPLEVCRTRLQDRRNFGNPDYANMSSAFRTIWRNEGVRGLYRGVTVNVMRVIPTTVCAFVLYEKVVAGIHSFHVTRTTSNAQRIALAAVPATEE